MPRPCQKRRASAAANRKPKPAGPPPIRHKARQKAIHNARRARGRGNMNGGRPSRNQPSGDEMEQDFISFASRGNNFHMLRSAGSQYDPIALDDMQGSELEEGQLITDDGSDSDSTDHLDMYDAGDMMINVQMDQSLPGKGKVQRAEVMFTIPHAISIYRGMWQTGFPLLTTRMERYGAQVANTSPDSALYNSLAPSTTSRQPSMSSATSDASDDIQETRNPARDYVFNWGKYTGQYFADVPENYLRTIGGQLDIYEAKHPGLREAFEYYRPGQGRTALAQQSRKLPRPRNDPKPQSEPQSVAQSRQAAPRNRKATRPNAPSPSETYTFDKGSHKGERLHEVPENYLRTLEGMKDVVNKWPGLKEALRDFNEKTGRKGRV
ncbi:Nn.00g103690.m01.CDS01 [Neocucurbitaria sp. VM-36]